MTGAEPLVPMADLAGRWGITSNTVSRRLSFLGIKPIRQGNFRFITPEQLEVADALQQHILSGKPMEAFPMPEQEEGRQVVRQVRDKPQVVRLAPEMAGFLAAIEASRPFDPLSRAKGLADAADNRLVLTNEDLSSLLSQNVSRWRNGHQSYGYEFLRHQQGRQVLWTVKRFIGEV